VASYSLSIKRSAARELEAVTRKGDRQRLTARIEGLAGNPRPRDCEKLAGRSDSYRIRQGNYRVVYTIDDRARSVVIFKIGHRRDVYR
jgi:mRNA interferase RelE/StbE